MLEKPGPVDDKCDRCVRRFSSNRDQKAFAVVGYRVLSLDRKRVRHMRRKQCARRSNANAIAAWRQCNRHGHERAVITDVEEFLPVVAPTRLVSSSVGNRPRSSRSREWTDIDPAGFRRTKCD